MEQLQTLAPWRLDCGICRCGFGDYSLRGFGIIGASRIRLWPASRSKCWGRHLSIERGNPDTQQLFVERAALDEPMLFYRPLVTVEPIEDFLNHLIVRWDMPRFKDGVPLILRGRSQ